MAIGSVAAPTGRNMALDACYGDGKAAGWPATVNLALFNGNPTGAGTELTGTGGYARVAVANTSVNFPNASAGVKSLGVTVEFAVSTGAFSSAFDYWAFFDGSGHLLDSGQVTDPVSGVPGAITVSATNTIVRFLATKLTITVV